MEYDVENESVHHRDEHTGNDFDNAKGGYLGDTKIVLRYLLKNTGVGDGYRIIMGGGLNIPSKNTLTKNPFLKVDNEYIPHRHFSMSNGTYNLISEFQFYYKRTANPVFFGGNISFEKPLKENSYYYLPPSSLKIMLSTIYKTFDKIDGSIDFSLSLESLSKAYWNDVHSPNSSAFIATPSIGYIFSTRLGAIGVNLQKPIFLEGSFAANEGNLDQETEVWQIVLSFRSMASKLN